MNNGWIKLYRKLIDDHLWTETTPKQKTVMITILLMANSQTKDWNRIGTSYHVDPGELVTSLKSIAEKAGIGISPDNVKTSLKMLKDSGFLTWKSSNKNRLITIANWGKYQGSQNQNSKQESQKITDTFPIGSQYFPTNKKLRSKEVKNKELNHNVEKQSSDQLKGQVHEVIAYLNSQTSKHFKANSKDTVKLISARLRDNYIVDDFKKVIDIKTSQWAGTDYDKFLRPSTLFAPNHFESYLNERPIKQKELSQHDGTSRDFGGSTRYRHEAKPEPIRTPQKGDEPF
ncbi:hypothetical protein B9K02_00520 [Lentilactobacillus kefiri]|uniref:conserved phage C-terminal domain-containing protein n=1 Tax=Lentilactobacillus kefiri TaxID=33962 RepID=UPI000BA71A9A|nr:conserved phage C-terminal domain-containing protein [Lentilactobacillus kefiri]PAK60597.1 hypothetical protein B9K02_00520 [Lentilactobacillus kefiri]